VAKTTLRGSQRDFSKARDGEETGGWGGRGVRAYKSTYRKGKVDTVTEGPSSFLIQEARRDIIPRKKDMKVSQRRRRGVGGL